MSAADETSTAGAGATSTGVRELTYLEAVTEAQVEEMARDERMIMMGQDLHASLYGGRGLVDRFGEERIRNLPTSETAAVGAAAGAAMMGLRPLCDLTMASFSFVAWDQFASQVSKAHYVTGGAVRVPVTYRVALAYDRGVGVQHSDRPHPMWMQMPGLKIVAPTTPAEARAMFKGAIRDDDPVIFLEDTYLWGTRGPVPDGDCEPIGAGSADLKRAGEDVTVVALGRTVLFALRAAEELAGERISAEVIDLRSLAPIDWATIFGSVERTGRLVVVDPAVRVCSAASEIAATVHEHRYASLRAPIARVTSPMVHTGYSQALERGLYPDAARIAAAARAVVTAG